MTPLVLLPGMMCDGRLFRSQIAAFGLMRAIHLPPIGRQDTMQALAVEVLAYAPPHFALAGLSMGGIVAMEMLRQAPDRITRIALLDTNPLAEAPEMQARRGPQIDRVRAGGLADVMRDEMKPNYLVESPAKPAILDLCMTMAMDLGPEVFVRQSTALRNRPDQQDTLRSCKKSALILCGRHDQLCPVARHELMHQLMPHARLEIIEEAGHLPTLERPRETTAALARWLEE